MKQYSAFDVIGPDMIGPSSSHTAGANRLGAMARKIARGDIKKATIYLHGSFAKTCKGHGTDRALVAGLLGISASDERLKDALKIADESGFLYEFRKADLGDVHPNTVKFTIEQSSGKTLEIMGASIGGGNIEITEIDGLKLKLTGEYPTLITRHRDCPGVISMVTGILADFGINIAFMSVYRHSKGQDAFMVIEADDSFDEGIEATLRNDVDGVKDAYSIIFTDGEA
ncbi:MAG: L-serine ammonia-lyase, iron-sulfur-dependent subunit beta [Peptostreptococcaceae bacterium]|nr:L-serine ammonia-lyase, iron-sulfur-dependent subunit beta [Peptostreptococcaceae bacterium]